jgi:clan AA aspartic protease
MYPNWSDGVGGFSIDFQIANAGDVVKAENGWLAEDKVRRLTIRGVVNSRVGRLVLPKSVVKQLRLPLGDKTQVRYADGRKMIRDTAKFVQVRIGNRRGTFTATVEPSRTEALIGAIVLEDLDYVVDCRNQRLVPRDPCFVVCEIG